MELTNTEPTHDTPERAVFVTDDNRRARRLRRGAYVAASLACLWLVGLGLGMFGLGGLPGISLGKQNNADAAVQPEPKSLELSRVARSLEPRSSGSASSRQNQRARAARSRSARARARAARAVKPPVSIPPPVSNPAPPPPAQQPVNPGGRQRGWARKGSEAPPGQVRRTQPPPPPPPSSRGQHRGQNETTSKPPPPGQSKKTPPPPPPPEG